MHQPRHLQWLCSVRRLRFTGGVIAQTNREREEGMSELSKNRLVNRRDFFRRTAGTAATAGLGASLISRASAASAQKTNPWAYDDSLFRRTDPKLIQFDETRRFSSLRSAPRCLAMGQDGNLLIGAGKFLTRYSVEGSQLKEIRLSDEVRCVKQAIDGLIYVGLRERVEVYDADFQPRGAWEKAPGKPYFTGLAVNGDNVFVADAGNRVVLRYDRTGKLNLRIGAKDKDKNIPGFIVPSPFFDLEIAPDGLLRVGNPGRHRVETYTPDGDFEGFWGQPGAAIANFCGCCNPINLAILSDGRMVTVEKGIPRVKVYSAEGAFESVVAGAESFVENAAACGPQDCTVGGLDAMADNQGRVYVLDFVAANVRVLEPKSNSVKKG